MSVDVKLDARRAFPKAQELLAGAPSVQPTPQTAGWYGSGLSEEAGAFAFVADGAGLDALIDQRVLVAFGDRLVFVYVLGSQALPEGTVLALSRRAFGELSRLSREVITANVAVVS